MTQTQLKIKPAYRTYFLLAFLLLLLPLTILMTLTRQEIRKQAAPEEQTASPPLPTPAQPEYVPGEVLVKFRQGVKFDPETQPLASFLKEHHITSIEKVFKGADNPQTEIRKFKQRFPDRQINETDAKKIDLSRTYKLIFDKEIPVEQIVQEFSQKTDIEYVEPNYIYSIDTIPEYPNDLFFLDDYPNNIGSRDPNWNPPHDYQWNIKKTNSSTNWLTDTSQVIVAVIDSGLDTTHPELGNVWVNLGEIPQDNVDNDQNGCVDDVNGCRIIWGSHEGDITDDNNHGTHVAGIISVKTNNEIGLAGVTHNTSIMAVKVINSEGYGRNEDVAEGIRYAVDNGARILNMSLGGRYSSTIKDALDYATSRGAISVVAAGNGNQYSPSHFPAAYKPAITVGGVDEELNKLRYAGFGPNIDVVAPAGGKPCRYFDKPSYCSNILSLKSSQNNEDQNLVVGNYYLRLSGTSMATPHVAGIIALLLAKNPSFTLQDIENYIRFNSLNPQGTTHTEQLGWGVINAQGDNFIPPGNIDFEIKYPADNSLVGNTFNVAGVITADNFERFEIQYRHEEGEWTNLGVSLVDDGQSPVFPTPPKEIAKVGTITLPDNAPIGQYEVKVTLFLTNDISLSAIRKIHYFKKAETQWLYNGEDIPPKSGSVLISDLDNDGLKEIIIFEFYNQYEGRERKSLVVFNHEYELLWEIPQTGQAVIGDIDKRSEGKEVVLQTTDGIFVHSANGSLIEDMGVNLRFSLANNILALDTDRNGVDELFVSSGSRLHSYEQDSNNQLKEKWNVPMRSSGNRLWPLGGDVNGDDFKEIVIVEGDKIKVINGRGEVIAEYAFSEQYPVDGMVLVDMDRDNKEEIVVHGKWKDLRAFKLIDNSLNVIWQFDYSGNLRFFSVADFNNNGYPEIYMDNGNDEGKIINKNGHEVFSETPPVYFSNSNNGGVPLADRDNNGLVDIYYLAQGYDYRQYFSLQEFGYENSQMSFPEGDWKSIFPQLENLDPTRGNYEFQYLMPFIPTAISDLDNNGRLDFIIAGIGIIEYPTEGVVYWPHRYHDYQRTGSYNFSPQTTGSCQCDLWAVVEDQCSEGYRATCTGKYDCECQQPTTLEAVQTWRVNWAQGNTNQADLDNNTRLNLLDYLILFSRWLK